MKKLLMAALLLAAPLHAQEGGQVASATGGVLRALDKISGNTIDLEITRGDSQSLGNLQITMVDCRYPVGDPAANAYAALEITENDSADPLYSGWMIASAPALHALEHFRYDIWVIRCSTS
ncbi:MULTISPECIES: DUF2155 domain-containing protein [Sulfitobacter]|uniref:DUF2155 domain-containing protein n=1 Tax=Sulfitobacter dubius TaxID=218673 RepID=A0ABY3ZQV4_9RHOB|nr:DUF2155 domain-containing protein [Sulfitobacter dubius]UOA15158.1 hypothetical protein DSM109990_01978 [Sulfitobacter dubius]WOI29424.1 DUF2155 domain-containing protein [Sulfitobacter dubius]SFG26723.1 hypothetical protein SAMN04488039_101298 [Sulfitobacter dubius]